MTINSLIRKTSPFVGNGSVATFPFTFKVFTQNEVVVVKKENATSQETTLTITADYTVTLNPDQNGNPGGSVTLTAGNLATGFTLVITSDLEALQQTDLTNQGGFYPEVINDALDKSVILHQQQQDELNRSIKFSLTNSIGSLEITEDAAARANKVLAFDGSGEFQVAQELGVFRGDWAAGVTYNKRDLVRDSGNYNVYICIGNHTSSGALPVKTNADIANWTLIVDAEYAGQQATNAAASAVLAQTAEQNAEQAKVLAIQAKDAAAQTEATVIAARNAAQAAASGAQQSETDAQTAEAAAVVAKDQAVAAAASAIASSGGGAVKVTVNDNQADTLSNKIVPGIGVSTRVTNAGGNEKLEVNSDAIIYAIALG